MRWPDRSRTIALVAMLAIVLGVLIGRDAIVLAVEAQAFNPPLPGRARPDDFGAPARRLSIASGERVLQASFVPVADPAAAAIAIFHGDEESLSHWAAVQAHLHAAGVASLVFDYSGYGASTGRPSVERLRQDALAAWAQFVAQTPQAARRIAFGFSLGSGVLIDAAPQLQPAPAAFVVAGGFASAREMAVALGYVPRWAAWLLPDLWNNEQRLAEVAAPVLIVHSRVDEVIPFGNAQRLCAAGGGPRRLLPLDGLAHDAPLRPASAPAFWQAVIDVTAGSGIDRLRAASPDCRG